MRGHYSSGLNKVLYSWTKENCDQEKAAGKKLSAKTMNQKYCLCVENMFIPPHIKNIDPPLVMA
jgi:hypothetical protein